MSGNEGVGVQEPERMKVVYIAGPYRADTVRGIVENIQAAEKVAIKYWRLGYAVLCPHTTAGLFDGVVSEDVFLEGTLELMRRCDIVVMMTTWRNSVGAVGEHNLAHQLGLEVLYE